MPGTGRLRCADLTRASTRRGANWIPTGHEGASEAVLNPSLPDTPGGRAVKDARDTVIPKRASWANTQQISERVCLELVLSSNTEVRREPNRVVGAVHRSRNERLSLPTCSKPGNSQGWSGSRE